jgi:hypothetical protein
MVILHHKAHPVKPGIRDIFLITISLPGSIAGKIIMEKKRTLMTGLFHEIITYVPHGGSSGFIPLQTRPHAGVGVPVQT